MHRCLPGAEAEVKGLIESSRKLRRAVVVVKLGSSKTLENIDLHIQLLENKLATIQRNTLSIKASYSQLKAATDFTSTNVMMKETTEFLQAIEETVTKFQKDKKEQYHIKKEMLRMKGELENSVTDPEEQQNEERDSVVNITVNDLRSIHGLLRGNAERKTFAVMTFHGKQRIGPVKIESGNKIRVSRVEEGVVPPRSFVIQLESLMQGSCSIRRVFLDLACGSIHLGSVIIKITDNCSTMALNFIHMCLGDMGPSYCHSGLRAKWNGESETIALGSYDVPHGGGTSTQAVFSREDFEQERQRTHECTVWRAGQVRGNFSFESASKVWIITKDDPHKKGKTLFGKVEEGLDILQNAISWYPDNSSRSQTLCSF
ncbi:uncharacterized protein [Macrobrachium rosenbergii]|uniref:uncharacterized protein isoform X1 n=1 Tax=Macrobrachium rosenbergii TaxID=79674 RepID=UPI0034D62FBD